MRACGVGAWLGVRGPPPLGRVVTPHFRGRAPRVSPLRANHAHRCLHHGASGDRPHPRSLPSYRSGEVPFARTASSCPEGSRHSRFHLGLDRCTPRPGLLVRGCLGCPAKPVTDPQAGNTAAQWYESSRTRPASYRRLPGYPHPTGWTPPVPRAILGIGESKFLLLSTFNHG